MSTALDWLKSHARLMISLVGVACIPLVYAGLLIAANSDPTGHLDDVPAMVVNLDSAAKTSTGDTVDLGPQIVDELTDSTDANNLSWVQASQADADKALEDGNALAVLTIPKGFSAAVASAGDEDPRRAHDTRLQLRTNDASNFIMGTIGRTVGTEVSDSVRQKVSKEYLDNIYVGFTDLHGRLGDAADGASQLADGSRDAKDGAGSLVVGLTQLADGSSQLDAGAVKLASGAGTLSTGASTLASGLDQLSAKTAELPSQAKQLDDGARALSTGATRVNTAAGQLAAGAKQASQGATQLSTGAAQVDDAAGKLAEGSRQVADGTGQLSAAADTVAGHVHEVASGAEETLGALGTLIEDTTGIPSSTTVDVAGTAARAQDTLAALASDPAFRAALEQAAQTDPQVTARFAALQKDLPAVRDGAAKTQKAIDRAAASAGVVRDKRGASIDELIATAKKVDGAAQGLKSSVNQLDDGARQVAAGNAQLAKNTPALKDGAAQLAKGNGQLADGTAQLAKNTPALKDGAKQLAGGTGRLAAAVPALSSAIGQLDDGGHQVASGASQLSSGASTLADGTATLVDGTKQAKDGSTSLESGLGQLQMGSTQLRDGLEDGVSQVPSYSDGDREHLSDVTSAPVGFEKTTSNAVANYGTGLTPYFLSLALWIGGIAFFMLMAPLPARLLARRLPAPVTALRAAIAPAVMALVQAAIATAIVLWGVRIDVVHPWALWGLASFASLAFVFLNAGLVALLGAPGRFLSLIMMVLQVGTAGGTYPWQTLPHFMQGIHPLFPMAYTVRSFRSLVAGGDLGGLGTTYAVLGLYGIVGLLLLVGACFAAPRRARVYDTATLAPGLPGGGREEGEYSFEHGRAALVGAGVAAGATAGETVGEPKHLAAPAVGLDDLLGSAPAPEPGESVEEPAVPSIDEASEAATDVAAEELADEATGTAGEAPEPAETSEPDSSSEDVEAAGGTAEPRD